MLRYESAVDINRPPADVFPYLIEREKQALWSDVPMVPLTPGPLKTGSRFQVTFGKGPLSMTLGLELTNVDPNSAMAWRTFSGPADWQGQYTVEPRGVGESRLSQTGTIAFRGVWRVLEPFLASEIRSGEVKELERLKAAAERSEG